jgi:hypothetical protein
MQMGMSQVDLAILLPAFAAAWNLTGGQTMFAAQKDSGRVYLSLDGLFAVEVPVGWELRKQEGSNEVTFLNGEVSVSVAAAETEAGDTVDQFLEVNKSLVRHMCPAAEVLAEGKVTVAGSSGAYFTMFCPGSRGRTIIRVAAALSHKRLFIFKIAAPSAELYAVQATIDNMAHSFRECDGLPQGKVRRHRAN